MHQRKPNIKKNGKDYTDLYVCLAVVWLSVHSLNVHNSFHFVKSILVVSNKALKAFMFRNEFIFNLTIIVYS